MIIKSKEGLNILKLTDGSETLFMDSSRIDDCINYLYEHKLRRISINPFQGYSSDNLDFLSRLEDYLEGITVLDDRYDYRPLNRLHKLKSLGFVDNRRDTIDLSNFPKLESLACDYSKRLLSLEGCERLQDLTLSGYKSPDKTLKQFPDLRSLKIFSLFQSNITSLDGIGKLLSLQEIALYRLSRLEDISAITDLSKTLIKIELDVCKRITNYDILAELKKMETLIISNSGAIPSLSFIKQMPKLNFLSFVGTNILDGDLSPTIGLGYVGFENKKHYSHTFDEISRFSPNSDENILGCFISGAANYSDEDPVIAERRTEKSELFRTYIWGELGIRNSLKKLKRSDYGNDLKLALFQFYVLPLLEELTYLKEIERYRSKERSIGIPIIIHDENFFNRSDLERRQFLKDEILEKLDLLAKVVKRNKLDTNIALLKADVDRILS